MHHELMHKPLFKESLSPMIVRNHTIIYNISVVYCYTHNWQSLDQIPTGD